MGSLTRGCALSCILELKKTPVGASSKSRHIFCFMSFIWRFIESSLPVLEDSFQKSLDDDSTINPRARLLRKNLITKLEFDRTACMKEKRYFACIIYSNKTERPVCYEGLAVFGFYTFALTIVFITKIGQTEDGAISSIQKSVIPFEILNPLCPSMMIRLRTPRTRLRDLFRSNMFERYSSICFLMVYIRS